MRKKFEFHEKEVLEQGCVGVSTGLSYYPASLCNTEELFLLGKIAAKYDVPFTFHQRNRDCLDNKYISPVQEVIDVARHCGCHVVLSHYRTYFGNCGRAKEICFPIEDALLEGLRVSADFYPYEIGCTYAAGILPIDILQKGPEFIMKLLYNQEAYNKLEKAIEQSMQIKQDSIILHAPKHKAFLGLSYKQIAEIKGVSPCHIILQLLKEEQLCLVHTSTPLPEKSTCNAMEQDFAFLLTKPYYNIGSDTIPCCQFPHPRSVGTFTRILEIARKYDIDLSIVANRTSYSAAQLYGLKDRGVIKQGAYADLVVFDSHTVASKAGYLTPFEKNCGIKHVMVNGKFAMENGQLQKANSGMQIRRGL